MGAVDYWCNIFTDEGIRQTFEDAAEVADVVQWWGLKFVGKTVEEFIALHGRSQRRPGLIPSAKMASYQTSQLIWDVQEDRSASSPRPRPAASSGLFGINPIEGMTGVRRLEESVRER